MQSGWLNLLGGRWLLLTGNSQYPVRTWSSRDAALEELEREGWTIAGPRRRHASNLKGIKAYGYVMTRTIH